MQSTEMQSGPLQGSDTAEGLTLTAQGLYDPANEHDACGVGFVAHIKGKKSHKIIEQGLLILCDLAGAVCGCGDGFAFDLADECC